MEGACASVSVQQMLQNSSPLPPHASLRHGRHVASPLTPPHRWRHRSVFVQAAAARSLHSFALQQSRPTPRGGGGAPSAHTASHSAPHRIAATHPQGSQRRNSGNSAPPRVQHAVRTARVRAATTARACGTTAHGAATRACGHAVPCAQHGTAQACTARKNLLSTSCTESCARCDHCSVPRRTTPCARGAQEPYRYSSRCKIASSVSAVPELSRSVPTRLAASRARSARSVTVTRSIGALQLPPACASYIETPLAHAYEHGHTRDARCIRAPHKRV
jgi:hypothetical protein